MTRRRGFTLGEAVVSIAAVGALGALLQPVKDAVGQASLRFKDADQLGEILDAHMMWAAMNRGAYPLPSNVDTLGETIDVGQEGDPALGVQLNNSSHIFSILIFNGLVAPETFVSPAENNEDVSAYTAYEYRNPETAANPAHAQWDPAFHATPNEAWNIETANNDGLIGNNSYAQNPALGKRERLWAMTGDPNHVVLGNRGPIYTGDAVDGWELVDGPGGKESNSVTFYNDVESWQGNIAYNDGRVEFEIEAAPEHLLWVFTELPKGQQVQRDNIFNNETRDGRGQDEGAGFPTVPGSTFIDGDDTDTNAFIRPVGSVDGETGQLGQIGFWVD
jgi:type II secretory pathway pseudopilin PulG